MTRASHRRLARSWAAALAWLVALVPPCGITSTSSAAETWEIALPGYHYDFPRDHFNHPSYRTEWWYYTGNLQSRDGRHFGFELTFFRQGIARPKPSGRAGSS